MRTLVFTVVSLFVLSGCTTTYTYTGQRNTIAEPDPVKTVAVMRTRCTDTRGGCDVNDSLDAVRASIANELEFKGMRIVREEELFQRARSRMDASAGVDLPILGELLAAGRLQEGSTFDDLPPQAKVALLQAANVDGIVESSIAIKEGHVTTLNDERDVTLQVRMALNPRADTTSVHRCTWTYASGLEGIGAAPHFTSTVEKGVLCALNAP